MAFLGLHWRRALATKLGFLPFLSTPLKTDLMGLEKIQGRRSDGERKGVTFGRRFIAGIRIRIPHGKIKTGKL